MTEPAAQAAYGVKDPVVERLNPVRGMSAARRRRLRRQAIAAVVVIAGWEAIGRYGTSTDLFFAPLSAIVMAGVKLWQSGDLQADIAASFQAFGYGMLIATAVGVVLGILIAVNQAVRDYVDPYVSALYATPLVAVAPLVILWFGLGVVSKVAVVFITAVFPVLINTSVGIRQTDANLIEVAHSFGATRAQVIRKVLVPSSVPFVIAGIRLAVGRGIVGVVVGELFGAQAGLGYLIFVSGQTFDVASLFVGVLLLAFAGVGLTALVHWIEGRIAKWHRFALDE
jgi:NitT/TauT family transport system permease protein